MTLENQRLPRAYMPQNLLSHCPLVGVALIFGKSSSTITIDIFLGDITNMSREQKAMEMYKNLLPRCMMFLHVLYILLPTVRDFWTLPDVRLSPTLSMYWVI
jgi:hypothetical protein